MEDIEDINNQIAIFRGKTIRKAIYKKEDLQNIYYSEEVNDDEVEGVLKKLDFVEIK